MKKRKKADSLTTAGGARREGLRSSLLRSQPSGLTRLHSVERDTSQTFERETLYLPASQTYLANLLVCLPFSERAQPEEDPSGRNVAHGRALLSLVPGGGRLVPAE